MNLPITAAEVDRIGLEAKKSGHPEKLAAYSTAQLTYQNMIETYFNEENPYAAYPDPSYVEKFKGEAESGDPIAEARHAIMQERLQMSERILSHADIRDTRQTQHLLQQLLREGGHVTDAHIKAAGDLAAKNSSLDNMVLYARLKEDQQAQQEKDI